MGRRGVPDRWLKYRPLGERIPGTRFIAFKVPLKEGLVRSLPENERFTTQVLMESVPNLGIVIDLTNTDRYYNSQDFLGQGIRYEKIFCRGHEIPSRSVVDKFFSCVDKYLEFLQSSTAEDGDEKLIGVHCTHGLNRTGYLVCRYMIRRLGFTPDDAISAFEKARGYPMEREEYLKSLRRTEDSSESVDNSLNVKSHSIQPVNQSNEDAMLSDDIPANGFPGRSRDTWIRDAPEPSQNLGTESFSDISRSDVFRRFPGNDGRRGFRSDAGGMRTSFSWASRNYRDDYYDNTSNPSRSFRASGHPYRREFDPEERSSRNGRMGFSRFFEQDSEENQTRRPHWYRARSSSSFFRDSRPHKSNWRDSDQFY